MPAPTGHTFIYTNSFDATSDLLIRELGTEAVFRFNTDLWRDYEIVVEPGGFTIANPAGRAISLESTSKFYWRKPLKKHLIPGTHLSTEEKYLEEEVWYAMREVVNLLWAEGKAVLVEPFGDARAGKIVQAARARPYFRVPPCRFVSGNRRALISGKTSVVKSLTSERVDDNAILYSTCVDEGELDSSFPWMIQELVHAEKDVTVAFVRDQLFAFELPRGSFLDRTLDWKEVSLEAIYQDWPVHELPRELSDRIFRFMADLRLHYGRLDFLRTSEGEYYFLEVNPNGEWGWLDNEGKFGLLKKIVREISPGTPIFPLSGARSGR